MEVEDVAIAALPASEAADASPFAAERSSASEPSASTAERDQRRQALLDSKIQLVRRRLGLIHRARPSRQSSLHIRSGDVVIVYSSPTNMVPVQITPGSIFSNKFGHFHHDDFIGLPYASRIHSRPLHTGYVTALPVTPELWTLSLTHRTQILYFADISLVLLQLSLLPGHVVLESGTGSGSLTTALARTIAPTGHVHTFEFNADRVRKARKDFDLLALTGLVTVHHWDVCRDGFPRVEGGADAVFLDLPSPWQVLASCKAALRHVGRLASFSPCIEQVQRVAMGLREGGWGEIRTMEVLLRELEVSEARVERMGRAKPTAQDLRRAEANGRSEDCAERPAKRAREETTEEVKDAGSASTSVRTAEVGDEVSAVVEAKAEDGDGDEEMWTKRRKQREMLASAGGLHAGVVGETDVRYPLALKSFAMARGHTGYLTFATNYNFSHG